MQKINKNFEINGPYTTNDYKSMKEVFESIIDNPTLQISEGLREKISTIYKPAYDDLRTHNPVLQKIDIIKQRYKYPASAIPHLEKAIILLYQILKKIYDSELQQDCNPLNYIVFDYPDDCKFLDATIKEILQDE